MGSCTGHREAEGVPGIGQRVSPEENLDAGQAGVRQQSDSLGRGCTDIPWESLKAFWGPQRRCSRRSCLVGKQRGSPSTLVPTPAL